MGGKFRMDLQEIGISAGNWVDSAQDRHYWRVLVNLRDPSAMELVIIKFNFLQAETYVHLSCTTFYSHIMTCRIWLYMLLIYIDEIIIIFNPSNFQLLLRNANINKGS